MLFFRSLHDYNSYYKATSNNHKKEKFSAVSWRGMSHRYAGARKETRIMLVAFLSVPLQDGTESGKLHLCTVTPSRVLLCTDRSPTHNCGLSYPYRGASLSSAVYQQMSFLAVVRSLSISGTAFPYTRGNTDQRAGKNGAPVRRPDWDHAGALTSPPRCL